MTSSLFTLPLSVLPRVTCMQLWRKGTWNRYWMILKVPFGKQIDKSYPLSLGSHSFCQHCWHGAGQSVNLQSKQYLRLCTVLTISPISGMLSCIVGKVTWYLNYFYSAMMRHHDEGNLKMEEFIARVQFQRPGERLSGQGAWWQVGKQAGQGTGLNTYILSARRRQRECYEWEWQELLKLQRPLF